MKSKLRKKYIALREELSGEKLEEQSLEIANKLLKLPIWEYEFYHLFLSISEKKEIDTEPILHILQGMDKNIVLSKSDFETNQLHNYLLTDTTTIKKNRWGIPEPQGGIEVPAHQIDVVFVPLLTFDRQGHRVGYGKGFYDIFLSGCSKDVIKVGLSLFEAEDNIPGILESDVPLDYCVTPSTIYNFKK
ncbi:5-formyltetrahydrofolate cyclo-ligase [Antarcticibacterium flavum]|uniref:5-formyltetrahydrofolate cyclo-ligase n=1 Tax=Antarcticibacterium flavum TaxID=2058175 RepID=A0A5B7X1Q7_9FLAO|nr:MULTISPECIES: 5-formyltetrahydrofolate cyclo-ligase [Antarcticibacterium]MCM4159092.1 5-formyltetrahydrofolate cyclo-ligase [Antarcticibacterium sp. W02-3]QCY69494.1 5-formyltetrahydrofolate cyclo-ligase [Antarcticibacterium flavum]